MHASLFCRFFFNKSLTIGAVARDTFTVVNYRLLQREIGVVRVTGLSRDKFTLGNISMVTSKRRKKPPMAFNVVNSWCLSIPKPNRANQVSSFNTYMKPQKNRICFPTFLANFTSLSYFEKRAHLSVWSECMYLCGCVCYDECCRGQ